jgi:regulator of sigma E protease
MTFVYILAAILIFGILIADHELGHFLAAKACGVPVNEFSIGMGPVLWERKRGETQYSLRAFPVGGYCAMEGEEDDSQDPRALNRQGFWKKFFIFAAGSAMNFLLGFVIVLLVYSSSKTFVTRQIVGLAPEFDSAVGLQAGDSLYAVNGERVYLVSDLSILTSLDKDGALDLTVLREGKKVTLSGVKLPYQSYTGNDGTQYTGYGLYLGTEKATALNKLKISWLNTVDFARDVRLSLKLLLTGQASVKDVGGPVSIVTTVVQVGKDSHTVRDAVENICYFAALIAVNLSIMNLLPIPALDGGHILFLVLDTLAMCLFRRSIPEKYESAINLVFFVALMAFMVLITFQDVFKAVQLVK